MSSSGVTNTNYNIQSDHVFNAIRAQQIMVAPNIVVSAHPGAVAGSIAFDQSTLKLYFSDGLVWHQIVNL